MRLIIFIILFLVLLLEGILFILFTSPGNSLLLPLANSYLQQKIPQAKVQLKKFYLKPGSIGLIAEINDAIHIRAKGDIDLFSQHFDINYTVDTQEIKTPTLTIKEHITIRGNAKGNADDMQIAGKGLAFRSTLRYDLALVKQTPQNIKIDITDADLQSLLLIAGQEPYASGTLSLHANMPNFAPLNPQVNARFSIKNGLLDSKRIARDFNLTLPAHTGYQTDFIIKTEDRRITFNGSINSDLLNLALKEGRYHLLSNSLATQYRLTVPQLQKLSSIIQAPLRGELVMDGMVSVKKDRPVITAHTKSFGGTMDLTYHADTLSATLDKVHNATLLYTFGQPKYLNGTSTANATFSSLKNLTGTFKIQTSGSTDQTAIKKAFDMDLGQKFALNAAVKGKFKAQKLLATLIAKTTMANLKATAIQYDLDKASLKADYLIDIPDMGKLQPLSGKIFKGDMRVTGKISQAKDLRITGQGKEFGGTIDFKLLNDKLKADVKGATVSKIMTMLDYPQVLEAISQATVDYNIATASGTLHAKLDNARILPNQLTDLLKQFKIIDLTKERFNNSRFDAHITKEIINFTLDARNKNNYFTIKNGKLVKKTGAINAKADLKIKGKDLQATIRGTLDNPKVSLDSSHYIENMVKEKVKKKYKKKIDKTKKKIKKNVGEKIKNLTEGLF